MSQTKKKWDSLVLSRARGDFWMLWRCHGILRFHFFLFLETTVRENNWMRTTSVTVMVFFFRKTHSQSNWSQLYSKFFLKNYEAPWQLHLKDILQLKILWTWINIDVEPASKRLTYYCMLLFLSNMPSF